MRGSGFPTGPSWSIKREMSLLLTIVLIAQYPAVDLISPLPRDECVRRLREKTDPPGWQIYTRIYGLEVKIYDSTVSPRPLAGYISDTDFQIGKRLQGGQSQARLFGEIIDDDGKTRLHCFVGVHPFVVVFFAFW